MYTKEAINLLKINYKAPEGRELGIAMGILVAWNQHHLAFKLDSAALVYNHCEGQYIAHEGEWEDNPHYKGLLRAANDQALVHKAVAEVISLAESKIKE